MDNLKEKINQLFILGYEGEDFRVNIDFVRLLENGLGGVIFFTHNIVEEQQFKNQVELIKSISKIRPFLSIDEEGGRVARIAKNSNFDSRGANTWTPTDTAAANKLIREPDGAP